MTQNNAFTPEYDLAPCGTVAAYRRHLRHTGAPVACDACRAANARLTADWKERNAYRSKKPRRPGKPRPKPRYSAPLSTTVDLDPLDLAVLYEEVMEARA